MMTLNQEIKALAFDLDDTLLNSKQCIGSHTREVLDQWFDAGRHLILATSRPIRAVRRFIDSDLLDRCHIITLNGAVSQYGQGEPSAYAKLRWLAKDIAVHPELALHARISIEFFGAEFATNASMSDEELAKYHCTTPDMVVPLDQVDFSKVSKVAIDGLGASIMHHVSWIREKGGSAIPALDGTFLNVVHPSVDKATALRSVLESIDVTPGEMIAFVTIFRI
jgi:hydroxymethylpyrimidine pyrophosphatase-like HAD family hydrolase